MSVGTLRTETPSARRRLARRAAWQRAYRAKQRSQRPPKPSGLTPEQEYARDGYRAAYEAWAVGERRLADERRELLALCGVTL